MQIATAAWLQDREPVRNEQAWLTEAGGSYKLRIGVVGGGDIGGSCRIWDRAG